MQSEQSKTKFQLPIVGWISLAVLLAEYLLLSQRFDVHVLTEHDRPWSVLGRMGDAATMGFLALAVTVALASRTRSMLSGEPRAPSLTTRRLHWWELGAGFACFGVGLWLSRLVLVPQAPSTGIVAAWAIALGLWLFCRTHWAWPVGGVRGIFSRRRVWGPIAAIALLSAAAGLGTRALWELQGDLVLNWVIALLRAAGEDPFRGPGNEIWLGDFGVDVAPVCSGYEGVGLMVAFVGGYLVVMRKELVPSRAWPLLPVAVVVVWLANVVRLAVLTWIGARISAPWAAGAFHSKAGWLLFCGVALSMVWIIQRWAGRHTGELPSPASRPAASRASAEARNDVAEFDATDQPATAALDTATSYYLAPLVAATAAALLTGLFFEPFDRLYGARVLVAFVALALVGYGFKGLRAGITWQGIAAGVLVFVLWVGLSTAPSAESMELFEDQLTALSSWERGSWFALRLIGGVVTVPICEELAFRGFLMRRLAARKFNALDYRMTPWWALGISSLLFGVLHGSWFAGTIAGLLYGGLLRWRGRLAEATVAHMVTNLCLMLSTIASGELPYWQ